MQGKLLIAHVPPSDQPADLLTKTMSKTKFSWLRDKIRVKDLQQLTTRSQTQLGLRGRDKAS